MSRDHLTEVKELIDKYENCYNKEIALKYAQELMRYHARWAVEQAEHNKMYESAAEKANGVIAQTNEENLQLRKRVQELEELAEHRLKMLKYCSDARRKYYGVIKKLYHFDGDVQEHSALADVLCSEILEGDLDE